MRCHSWIVEPENPKQLAETIRYVYKHPGEAKPKGQKAREKCKREYSWDAIEKILMKDFENYKTK